MEEKIVVWDTTTGQKVGNLGGDAYDTILLAINPAGTLLATRDLQGRAMVWDYEKGKVLLRVPGSEHVDTVTFTPDGTRLITGAFDYRNDRIGVGPVKVWDYRSGKVLKTFPANGVK